MQRTDPKQVRPAAGEQASSGAGWAEAKGGRKKKVAGRANDGSRDQPRSREGQAQTKGRTVEVRAKGQTSEKVKGRAGESGRAGERRAESRDQGAGRARERPGGE